jgi:hypothetical protein
MQRTYRLIEFGARVCASRWHTPDGDQATFFGMAASAAVGGFPKQK